MVKISIIIPCYNVEMYIANCLDSIINQTIGCELMEIILVDDASTDNTVSIIKEYERKYPDQILLILNEKQQKQGRARNIGLTYATGEYISFIDADDWIDLNTYKILLWIADRNGCDIIQFEKIRAESFHELTKSNRKDYQIYEYFRTEDVRALLFDLEILSNTCTNKFYRKDIILKAGARFAEGVAYEEPLFVYPLKFYVNRVGVLKQGLYYYRINPNGTMNKYMQKASTILDHLSVQLELYEFMKQTSWYVAYKYEIDCYFIHSFFREPFIFLAGRGIVVPVSIFKYMCKVVKLCLPEYRVNPYLNITEKLKENKEIDERIIFRIEELLTLTDKNIEEELIEIYNVIRNSLFSH